MHSHIRKFPTIPTLAIEVISPSQTIQAMLDKARLFVRAGVKVVWTVEPYRRSMFVTTPAQEQVFHNEPVESEGIRIDFTDIFAG